MAARPSAPDSLISSESEAARAQVAPERLQQLDTTYKLSASQCMTVGKALEEVADACDEAHEEDGEDEDFEDYENALRRHAAALLCEGGETWELKIDESNTLAPKGPGARGSDGLGIEPFLACLEDWEASGAQLLKPLEVLLPWPRAAARDRALHLAEQVLAEARSLGGDPAALSTLEKALKKARAAKDLSKPRTFEALATKLQPLYQQLSARRMRRRERPGMQKKTSRSTRMRT